MMCTIPEMIQTSKINDPQIILGMQWYPSLRIWSKSNGLSDAAFFLCNFQTFLPQILYFQIPYNTLCLTPTPPPKKSYCFQKLLGHVGGLHIPKSI